MNIKLLNSKERVERVIKCLDTNRIKDKSEAKFLVVLEESKDYKIMKNDEMLYFYKDAIVDYYQAIHFSWTALNSNLEESTGDFRIFIMKNSV